MVLVALERRKKWGWGFRGAKGRPKTLQKLRFVVALAALHLVAGEIQILVKMLTGKAIALDLQARDSIAAVNFSSIRASIRSSP